METNLKYNLNIDDYPIRKIRQIYPIDDVVVITATGIPINETFASYMENNLDELCDHFHKDLILKVSIPHVPKNSSMGYRFESGDEFDTINLDEFEHDENESYPWESYDEDEYDDDDEDFEELVDNDTDIPDFGYTEEFDEAGVYYNFVNIYPEIVPGGDEEYDFHQAILECMQPSHYGVDESIELNEYIDSEGDDWMFTFSFRHPISLSNDLMPNPILSEGTIKNSDKVIFSLMHMISGGIVNIINSETMKLIIKNMIGLVVRHGRTPFVGTIRFQILIDRLGEELRNNYHIWNTALYNMILEDYVDYESKITPPISIEKNNFYFKPTDFLGQYYFPKGLKKKEEGKENGRKESKENDIVIKKDGVKTKNNKKSSNTKSKNSGSSRRTKGSRKSRPAADSADSSNGITGI